MSPVDYVATPGPTSDEGKAAAARNAWTGGQAVKLRQIIKELNQAMRAQRNFLSQ